jgi:hypothetical protein
MNVDQTFQTKPASDTIAEHILITKAQSAVFMGAVPPTSSRIADMFADCSNRQLSFRFDIGLLEIFGNIPAPAYGRPIVRG